MGALFQLPSKQVRAVGKAVKRKARQQKPLKLTAEALRKKFAESVPGRVYWLLVRTLMGWPCMCPLLLQMTTAGLRGACAPLLTERACERS
jgi:hypothetical protein